MESVPHNNAKSKHEDKRLETKQHIQLRELRLE